MKKIFLKLQIVLSLLLVLSPALLNADTEREINMRWKEIPGAKYYIFELKDSSGVVIIKEKITTNEFKLKMKPGVYQRRILVYNKLEELAASSDWSFLNVLDIKPEYEAEIKWKGIQEASYYIFELKDANGKIIYRKTTKEPYIKLKLQEGSYQKRLRIFNKLGEEEVTSGWSPYNVVVNKKKEEVSDNKASIKDWGIVLRSSLIPGWGEYYAGKKYENQPQRIRGYLYFYSFLFSSLFYAYSYQQFNKNSSAFQQGAMNDVLIAALVPRNNIALKNLMVLRGVSNLNSGMSGLSSNASLASAAASIMAFIYVIQWVDAFIINYKLNNELAPNHSYQQEQKRIILDVAKQRDLNFTDINYRIYFSTSF